MAKRKSKILHFPTLSRFNSEDWELRLELIGVPMAISPLHDKDLNADGTLKKPHWHIIYIASNPVTADSVRKEYNET